MIKSEKKMMMLMKKRITSIIMYYMDFFFFFWQFGKFPHPDGLVRLGGVVVYMGSDDAVRSLY